MSLSSFLHIRDLKNSFLLLLVFIVFCFHSCSSISQNIFTKDYKNDFLPFGDAPRFTPTIEEINLAEMLVNDQLENLNLNQENQGGSCPIIHTELRKYDRQYVGYLDQSGQRIIWINFFWSRRVAATNLKEEVIIVFDGCSYYWNVKVSIDKKLLFELNVNGNS